LSAEGIANRYGQVSQGPYCGEFECNAPLVSPGDANAETIQQLVARFEQARRSAVGQAHGMGSNRGGQACDATIWVVVRRYRHGTDERDHGAMAGDETKLSKRVISFGSSAED
jgi:hypothetical protein